VGTGSEPEKKKTSKKITSRGFPVPDGGGEKGPRSWEREILTDRIGSGGPGQLKLPQSKREKGRQSYGDQKVGRGRLH